MTKYTNSYFLVTGACGFIGSHLCEHLLAHGKKVIGIDNFDPFYERSFKEKNLQLIKKQAKTQEQFLFFEVSILENQKMQKLLNPYTIELVIHLAAKAGVRPSLVDPLGYTATNINGTVNILELCRMKKIKKHILASSSSVYGNNKKVPFAETDNVDQAISPYAATKKACEVLAYTYARLYQINTAVLRFFTVYGPRQRPDLAIHKFCRLISQGKPIDFYGDGTTKRDYTYIDDIIDGILKTIAWLYTTETQNQNFKYEIFNLGESCTTELIRLVNLIEEGLQKKAIRRNSDLPPGDVPITYADIAKAKKILDYKPTTLLETGLKKFIIWFAKK